MKILWIDTETTGLDPARHEIIQLAGIIEINKVIKDSFNFRCRPTNPGTVSEEALKVIGHTLDEIRQWPEPRSLFKGFLQTIGPYINKHNKNDKYIVGGQNVEFDYRFLEATAKLHKFDYLFAYLGYHKIDTIHMAMIAKLLGRLDVPNLRLQTLAKHLNIPLDDNAHDAFADITATRQVAQQLLRIIAGGGNNHAATNVNQNGA